MTIRERANGTFELRVTHPSLSRPLYSSHATRELAEQERIARLASLDSGEPAPARREGRAPRISAVLRQYLNEASIAPSDEPLVLQLRDQLEVTTASLTYGWVEAWVRGMKREKRLTPGSIRKRVECLARAIDWWNRKVHEISELPANPLRLLPRGYSSYGPGDGPQRVDVERDRRLGADEHARIVAALEGVKRPDRQRPLPTDPDLRRLYLLIVNTGLRLSEAYRLRDTDLRFDLRTIHVAREHAKTGVARDVPMTREVYALLEPVRGRAGLVFPFWDGDPTQLKRVTARLSQRFVSVFAYAAVEDLTEHDLRHEATCRWMEMLDAQGRWLFRSEEVQRITGHRTERTFRRYLSLRGSDLAERLWS